MTDDVVQIPAERIPPIATEAASASKVIAALLLSLFVIACIAAAATLTDGKHKGDRPEDSAEAVGHAVGTVIGVFLIVGLPGIYGFRSARNASRATRAAAATANRGYSWRLSGKFLIAADSAGVPHPELSFKITNKLRTMLLALPPARVYGRD